MLFLNVSHSYRKWLVKYVFSKFGFLPVDSLHSEDDLHMVEDLLITENVVRLQDNFIFASSISGIEKKMRIMHKSMVKILSPLENITACEFLVRTFIIQEWICFPHLVSYCSDIPELKLIR